ncbi:MAG TPA: AmmeMemoRadiSam system protein A [Syntrophomonadaceae bacterium]|nr:AmmeMemoRadiSam system protein A [Syntrophomonadaceae bacterium]
MITYLTLSPHPPLIVPAIGGRSLKDVENTVLGMQEMAQALVASQPEIVLFLTPHGNVFSDCVTCLGSPELYGDFGRFGYGEIAFNYNNELNFIQKIREKAELEDIDFIVINEEIAERNKLNRELDHGILVPLHYLKEAGLADDLPIVPISIGLLPTLLLYKFGLLIQKVAKEFGKRVAIVASGDMSHRLKDDGPYSFHPDGAKFDNLIKEALANKEIDKIVNLDSSLRDNAGECAYPSIVIMLGCMDGYDFKSQVYSYEGPFGVGYLTAGFELTTSKDSYLKEMQREIEAGLLVKRKNESKPVRWARLVLENYVRNGIKPSLPAELQELKGEKGATFVTLKKGGQLRGCIGTILPVHSNLAEEIASNAVSSATRDSRFSPVKVNELTDLTYSVDILSAPEECKQDELDSEEYGVIVTKGNRRGLLLPNLEGVDTVEDQLAIALEKAGISPDEDYRIERFKVDRYY